MRLLLLWSLIGLPYAICLSSRSTSTRHNSPIIFDIERASGAVSTTSSRRRHKRAQAITENISNGAYAYYANVTIGTPPQRVSLWVANAAADTWLNAYTGYCASKTPSPCAGSLYSPNTSSTYQYLKSNSTFNDRYEKNSQTLNVSGDWVSDTMGIGPVQITGLQFGVAYNTTQTPGALGLGPVAAEEGSTNYLDLISQMLSQNAIQTAAYSMWLDAKSSKGGKIYFGSVDTNKFQGNLHTLPMQIDGTKYDYSQVNVQELVLSTSTGNVTVANNSNTMVIDCGTAYMYLPSIIAEPIYQHFETKEDEYGDPIIPVHKIDYKTTFRFGFGGFTIDVPIEDVLDTLNDTYSYFEIFNGGTDYGTLGIPFMRNAFTVFDYSHNQISLAPSNHAATSEKVQEISQNGVVGMNLVGVASTTATSITTTAVGTHRPSNTALNPSSNTASTSPTSTATSSAKSGLSTGAKIGIGVGVGLGGLGIIIAILAFLLFGRHHRTHDSPSAVAKRKADRASTQRPQSDPYANPGYTHTMAAADEHEDALPEMSYRLNGPHYSADPMFLRHEME